MDDVTYAALKGKLDELTYQNKLLNRANKNAKRENKYLKHIIKKMKEQQNKNYKKRKLIVANEDY